MNDVLDTAFLSVRRIINDLQSEKEIYRRMLELIIRSPDEDAKIIALMGLGRVTVTVQDNSFGSNNNADLPHLP